MPKIVKANPTPRIATTIPKITLNMAINKPSARGIVIGVEKIARIINQMVLTSCRGRLKSDDSGSDCSPALIE